MDIDVIIVVKSFEELIIFLDRLLFMRAYMESYSCNSRIYIG